MPRGSLLPERAPRTGVGLNNELKYPETSMRRENAPAYHRSFRLSTAACASASHSYLAYTFPIRWSPTLSQTYPEFENPDIRKHNIDSHVAPSNVRTSPVHSTSPHKPHQTLPAAPSHSSCRPGHAPGCGRRWVREWSERRAAGYASESSGLRADMHQSKTVLAKPCKCVEKNT